MSAELNRDDLLRLTTAIVASYLRKHSIPPAEIPKIIHTIHASLGSLGNGAPATPEAQSPAVPIKRSVTLDYIVCLEDGKKLKMLKRYLRANFNLTPDEYRTKWELPPDYPMVAPNYSATRSAFAKKMGLGREHRATPSRRKTKRA